MTILISKRTISNPLQFLSLWNETHSYITLKQHSNINEFGDKTRITRIASLWGNYLFKKTILFISSFHFRSKYQRLPKYWQKQKDRYLLYSLHFFFQKGFVKKWEWRWKSDIRMNLCHFSHESIGVCASKPASPIRGCNRAVRAPSKRTICPIPVEFHLFVHPSIRLGAIIWDAGENNDVNKFIQNSWTLDIEYQYQAESSKEQKTWYFSSGGAFWRKQ